MNLYKIEYVYNKDKYNEDSSNSLVQPGFENINSYFNTLPTHIISVDFFEAANAAMNILPKNPYIYVTNVSPIEINIKILKA